MPPPSLSLPDGSAFFLLPRRMAGAARQRSWLSALFEIPLGFFGAADNFSRLWQR
jgi:hypothetical protein